MSYTFPRVVEYKGEVWTKVYDPGDPTTVMPNVETPKVQALVGKWADIPMENGQTARLYLVRIDLLYPASMNQSSARPAQIVRGYRAYQQERKVEYVPPQEMVMYVKDMSYDGDDITEGFFKAILGVSMAETKSEVDTQWAEQLLKNQEQQLQPQSKPDVVKASSIEKV